MLLHTGCTSFICLPKSQLASAPNTESGGRGGNVDAEVRTGSVEKIIGDNPHHHTPTQAKADGPPECEKLGESESEGSNDVHYTEAAAVWLGSRLASLGLAVSSSQSKYMYRRPNFCTARSRLPQLINQRWGETREKVLTFHYKKKNR